MRRLIGLALLAFTVPAGALAQSAPPVVQPARPSQRPPRPPHPGGYGHNVRPVIYVNASDYLAPAPTPTAKPSHHAPRKKTATGEDVFETHSTANQ